MSEQQAYNVGVVKKLYEAALRTPDWMQELSRDIHPDIISYEADGLPYGGTYRGPEGFARLVRIMQGTWDDMYFRPTEFLSGGDYVICYVELSGVGKKTGLSFSMPLAELYRFQDGKIIEFRPIYYDTKRCAEVFGETFSLAAAR